MKKKKILIIDDNNEFVYLITRQLNKRLPNIIIITENSGLNAIKKTVEELPDIILLDIKLPGLDGYEVTQKIKMDSKTKNIPIIMLTAIKSDQDIYTKAVQCGADFFLSKPIEPVELIAQINTLLRMKEAEDKILKERDFLEEQVIKRTLELRKSEDRYRRITEAITDYIYTVHIDQKGKPYKTIYRESSFAVTGYTVEELEKDKDLWYKMIHDDDKPIVERQIKNILKENKFETIEHRLVHKTGNIIWVQNTPVPSFNEKGKLISYDGVVHNVTDRKLTEDKFKTILQTAIDGFFIIDVTGKIIDVNDAFCRMFEYNKEELLKKNIQELFIDEKEEMFLKENLKDYQKSIIEKGSYIFDFIGLKKNKDKIYTELSVKYANFFNDNFFIIFIKDITQKKLDEEESRKNELQLIQAEKMATIGILLSGIAHEINNPNNFILFNTSVLVDIWKEFLKLFDNFISMEEQEKLLVSSMPFLSVKKETTYIINGLLDGSTRIKNIIENLKEFIQPSSGIWDQNVDVNKVIKSASVIVNHLIRKTTDNYSVDYGLNIPHITGNSQQLEQVIINLIVNSCQALTSRTQFINISSKFNRDNNMIILIVKDEGKGISKNNLNKILSPFYTTKINTGGTGLGLSISYRIIEKFNGKMEFVSEEGKGTTVIISLPLEREVKL
ncbi:MAG: PAS domain S-box protein [Spirochaetes bacterium]|nr:PAS domain S-box protein [Spirochaetota bacterium]